MALEDMFRAYDVRGNTETELNPGVMRDIGRAYATGLEADTTIVGHDVRETSPSLAKAFIKGVTQSGVDVVDVGFAPYGPVLFHGWKEVLPSAYITASHLPKEWNGVKFAHGNGVGYTVEENMAVRDRFFDRAFKRGKGRVTSAAPVDAYRKHVQSRVAPNDLTVLMDCGNGSSCGVAPALFRAAGVTVQGLHDEPDGSFPNRDSDVTDETLGTLKAEMRSGEFDMGVAYDGDADRVAVVDNRGELLSAEELAAALLPHVAQEHDGPVVANVECSRMLEDIAEEHGRKVVRVRVGHTYLFEAMQRHGACLGVEKSGHMGVPHVLPLDDGIATSLYAADVVSKLERPLSDVVNDLPEYYKGRFTYSAPDSEKFGVIELVQDWLSDQYANVNTMDGVRVDMDDGWALIRASNTSPKIRLTIEASVADRFEKMHREFTDILQDAIEEQATIEAERMEAEADIDVDREDWMVDPAPEEENEETAADAGSEPHE